VDTSNELVSVRVAGAKKRRRSVEERRKIVDATLQPGALVSRVARRHDVNANQVFHWRKLYREGRRARRGPSTPVGMTERAGDGEKNEERFHRTKSVRWASGSLSASRHRSSRKKGGIAQGGGSKREGKKRRLAPVEMTVRGCSEHLMMAMAIRSGARFCRGPSLRSG
jgi:transposase-like protein